MMFSSADGGGGISIAASAQKLEVDNRISLRYYYRIADNLLRQADIYREENNLIDLYIMLLRFSSLVTETIPNHWDYHASHIQERNSFKKKLSTAILELETLKPAVKRRLDEINMKSRNQSSSWTNPAQTQDISLEWPPAIKKNSSIYETRQVQASRSLIQEPRVIHGFQTPPNRVLQSKFFDDKYRKISLSMPRPRQETLLKHSILGPNGLHGQWQPPRVNRGVQYPSNLDLTPIEIPLLQPLKSDEPVLIKDANDPEANKPVLESVLLLHDEMASLHAEDPSSISTLDITGAPDTLEIIRQPSPPPVLANVQDLVVATPSHVSDSVSGEMGLLQDELIRSETPLQVHISTTLMDSFLRLAKSNSDRDLETCGVLAGSLKNRKFYVTSLIIPKQESTPNSCQATNEEEIFEYQDKESLFTLGWIHTHPTQTCFMSSIDVHTHYSYQIMLPEAVAIVMAPRDSSRKHGIFRLTTPGGMSLIRNCNHRGFHHHEQPPNGGPIYDHCTDVYMSPKLKFDVVDFR